MSKPVHRTDASAKPSTEPSPGQQQLLEDLRAELARIEALKLRCHRLNHVRPEAPEATVLRFILFSLQRAFFRLDDAERLGLPLACTYEDGCERIDVVRPLADVIDLAPFLAQRRAPARS